jgi:uncharacterized Zn finger protein
MMDGFICDKCHSENTRARVLGLPFYYRVRVKCLRCGSAYKMSQRWVRPRRWRQSGHVHVAHQATEAPQEFKMIINQDPEKEGGAVN